MGTPGSQGASAGKGQGSGSKKGPGGQSYGNDDDDDDFQDFVDMEKMDSKIPNLNPELFHRLDECVDYVYNPDENRSAGSSGTKLNVPKWLDEVDKLFPQKTKEVMHKDFVKTSKLQEIMNHPELFDKLEANTEILEMILSMKDMFSPQIREKAKQLVQRVVDQLIDKLRVGIKRSITGALRKDKHTPVKCFRNIDWKQTIQRNIVHYDPKMQKIILQEPRFFSREREAE